MTKHARRARLSDAERIEQRIVFLEGHIDAHTLGDLIPKLRLLKQRDAAAPITMYIDSPGGHIGPTLELLEAIDALKTPIHTHCLLCADGPAALLLAYGARGERSAASTSQMSFVRCDVQGNFETPFSRALATATGKTIEAIIAACRGNLNFTPDEAKAYGLIDRVED
jgi:ATP-dependent Clp protease protease subunit